MAYNILVDFGMAYFKDYAVVKLFEQDYKDFLESNIENYRPLQDNNLWKDLKIIIDNISPLSLLFASVKDEMNVDTKLLYTEYIETTNILERIMDYPDYIIRTDIITFIEDIIRAGGLSFNDERKTQLIVTILCDNEKQSNYILEHTQFNTIIGYDEIIPKKYEAIYISNSKDLSLISTHVLDNTDTYIAVRRSNLTSTKSIELNKDRKDYLIKLKGISLFNNQFSKLDIKG